jgi:ABC-type uncharacterized transport system substrate-binding protein
LLDATSTLPIVFANVVDPVGAGFVASLARPGGNVTGFASYEFGFPIKWLELLKQIAPGVTRAAVLRDPTISALIGQFAAIQGAAPSFGVEVMPIDVRDGDELQRAVAGFLRGPNDGLIVLGGPRSNAQRDLIAAMIAGQPHSCGLLRTLLRRRWRPCLLRARFRRPASARGRIR